VEGICPCGDTLCAGNGDGSTLGQCKEITISPFHTGSVIITGARKFAQIEKAYVFINKILVKHCKEVIKPFPTKAPPVTQPPAYVKEKAKGTKSKKASSTQKV
jgi:hypothetical protein